MMNSSQTSAGGSGVRKWEMVFHFLLFSSCLTGLAGCLPASTTGGGSEVDPSLHGATALAIDQGEASYYGDAFEGRQTASGETFRQTALTAAHRSYPFGTILRVTN